MQVSLTPPRLIHKYPQGWHLSCALLPSIYLNDFQPGSILSFVNVCWVLKSKSAFILGAGWSSLPGISRNMPYLVLTPPLARLMSGNLQGMSFVVILSATATLYYHVGCVSSVHIWGYVNDNLWSSTAYKPYNSKQTQLWSIHQSIHPPIDIANTWA